MSQLPQGTDLQTLPSDIKNTLTAALSDSKEDIRSIARLSNVEQAWANRESDVQEIRTITSHHSTQFIAIGRHIEDLDNRGRRKNIRIRGLPEAIEPDQLSMTLQSIFNYPLDQPPETSIELERVHRALCARRREGEPPRDFICCPMNFPLVEEIIQYAKIYLQQDSNRIGSTYKKAQYIEYTNSSYTEEKKKPSWQGIVGPIVRAEIGDNITIHLLNNASRPWLSSSRDIYSGLVGVMLICKTGVLEKKKKIKEEYILMLTVMDENMSWYIDENINNFCTNPASVDKDDEDFLNSNLKHCINGYMFGNLPGLSVCDNIDVKWYMFSLGNEVDVHSVYFYGHVLTYQHRRVDSISLFPASMVQASMLTQNPGKWLVTSQVAEHLEAGMQAIYEVRNCSKVCHCRTNSSVRRYYIAAVETVWNYGPTSINQFTGKKLDDPESDSAKYFERNEKSIGGSYKKAVFKEFTDSTFTMEKPRSKKEQHLGILGFTNNDLNGQSGPSHVAPRDTVLYKWKVPDTVAPTSEDLNCIAWLYYSSVDPVKDVYSGLVGPLLVCKKLNGNNQVNAGEGYDYVLMPTVFDENKSWYLQDNINEFIGSQISVDVEDPGFMESNTMHSINGYMYGNQPGLDLCVGSEIRWHILGLGTVIDIHGIHFTGNTFQIHKTTRDVVSITPHISYSAVMTPDNIGVFNVECMTADHYRSGMRQHYRVNTCGKVSAKQRPASRTVTYYIAAEEIEWDYSPSRTWEYGWHPENSESPGDVFLNKTRTTIGSIYKKVVYRGYIDESFTRRRKRTDDEVHLGILGPFIYGNIGDTIKVVFRNKASRMYSIYAHGLKPRSNEKNPAQPGETKTYVWDVPERSGPNRNETDCLTWAYYSDVDQVKDTYSGLIGPIVICKRSYNPINAYRSPPVRFAVLFMVLDENMSWYLDENIQTYALYPNEVDKENSEFIESNKMHSINGKMYANAIGLTMTVGDYVVWHIMGMGNEVDIHTAHWHGHSLKYTRGRELQTDVFEFLPGTFQTASMTAKTPGTWLMHCHVDDHLYAGMVTVYSVLGKNYS
ncbi:ceruloplasmin-like [Pyxicephalus adspersus]|uniref:ceruloplasmin-like n=1 Tax=Pyxicephalus adspersus TaxID=30357 RepID=UPI003B5978E5